MLELAEALVGAGQAVTVYSARIDEGLAATPGISWIRVKRPKIGLASILIFPRRVKRSLSERHDLVCVMGACAFPKTPYVYYACFSHSGWRSSFQAAGGRPGLYHRIHAAIGERLEKRCLGRCSGLIAISPRIAEEAGSFLPPGTPTWIVPGGVDLSDFSRVSPGARAEARGSLGLDEDDFVICLIGEYATGRKGLEGLLAAVAAGSDPKEHLLVHGRGRRANLLSRLERLGLTGRVHLVDPSLPPQVVLAASDLAAVPSLYEPFSLVALEASASAVPVVISKGAGAAELLGSEGGAALLVDDHDRVSLREAIDHIKSSPGLAREIGKRAREIVERYTWQDVSREGAEALEKAAVRLEGNGRSKVVYVLDTMADVRTVEMFASCFDLTVLARGTLPNKVTWPPRFPGPEKFVELAGGRIGFALRAAGWLVKNRSRYDVAIALDDLVAAFAATLARPLSGRPFMIQLLRTTEEYYRSKRQTGLRGPRYWLGLLAVKFLVGLNHRAADYIACGSPYVASRTRGRPARVRVAFNHGVDGAFKRVMTKQEARRRLGLPLEEAIVLWRSRVAPEKDPETFLKAAKILKDEGRKLNVLYVGGEYRDFLAVAKGFGVPVIALDAVHPLEELPYYYIASDVVVQTSRVEALGWSPLESLACGVPVVVSDTGGLSIFIKHEETGLLAPVGDAEGIARSIARLIDDPEAGAEMARRGREVVLRMAGATVSEAQWRSLVEEATAKVSSAEGP